jgi:predicted  nucleic acid-binding Zn-ribbon protein
LTDPTTLPAALVELDRALADLARLRVKLADQRGELDNVYVLLRDATAQSAALAIEMAHARAEREQLRDSLESTTELVDELTAERSALRRRVEELTSCADDLRAKALR